MKKRKPPRKPSKSAAPVAKPPVQTSQAAGGAPPRFSLRWAVLGATLAVAVGVWFWLTRGHQDDKADASGLALLGKDGSQGSPPPPAQRDKDNGSSQPRKQPSGASSGKEPGGLLEEVGRKGGADDEPEGALRTNPELEKRFHAVVEVSNRLKREDKRLLGDYEKSLRALEKDLARARKARPADPVPAWLTGELLLLINGHPDEILPHLRLAIERGLNRPRVFATLARTLTESNQPDEAFRSAVKALGLDGKDRYAWNAFTRAAFNTEHFAEVVARVDRSFPNEKPEWAEEIRKAAIAGQGRWEAEQKLRAAEQKADLPRVRLLIEHRRFARDPQGVPLTKIESTGKGEVVLELFEDQAPATVANFLTLIEQKVYDGTRFYLAVPATLVAGGDPKSRTGDAADDGSGGPGYVIPDEFNRAGARNHFRGSLSMVSRGPHTAGSQFLVTLAPGREMDGHFTVFGRVLKGQDVLDRITPGRTNKHVGFGRIVPGDLLVRAEVLRKRPHEYRVIKEQPK